MKMWDNNATFLPFFLEGLPSSNDDTILWLVGQVLFKAKKQQQQKAVSNLE